MEQQRHPHAKERRRQRRLHISCSECRRRKIRCSRDTPCQQCARGDRADRCHYDYDPASQERLVTGQIVFEVEPRASQRSRSAVGPAAQSNPPGRRDGAEMTASAGAACHDTAPGAVIAPLRQFWHGSGAGDEYVSPFNGRKMAVPKEVMFGEDEATVFWGRSHEANFVPRITDMLTMLLRSAENSDTSTLLEVERHTRPRDQPSLETDRELLGLVPPREITDRLWQTFTEHFGFYRRVLHLPTFERDYLYFWATHTAPPHFLPQLLSVCAIASSFRDEDRLHREDQVRTWIEAVRLWLFKADPRAQMTLGLLQAHLLMLVAGDVHWIKIDRSWSSSGTLLRNAISAGLHREPRDFFRISPYHGEIRRTLWYAIAEYDLMTCFAKGRVPSVREDEYDCQPPAGHWEEPTTQSIEPGLPLRAADVPANPYIGAVLAKSLPLRSRVCHAVNSIKLKIDYDEVLRLDAELKLFVHEVRSASATERSSFQQTLSSILSQRAVVALHAPFVTRAVHDPKWSYSRTRCLETSAAILSSALALLENYSPGGDCGPFATITNICRCEVSNSVFLICHELLAQVVEQQGPAEHLNPSSLGRWDLQGKGALIGLVERTSAALERVSKPDLISQRTCAWVRLSAELCRATVMPAGEQTLTAMRGAIGSGIRAWRSNGLAPQLGNGVDLGADLNSHYAGNSTTEFGGALDEDYFNLFFDMNRLGSFE